MNDLRPKLRCRIPESLIRHCPDTKCVATKVCQHNHRIDQERDWVRNIPTGHGGVVQVQGERLSTGELIDFRRKAGVEPFVEPKTKSGLD